VTRRDINIQSRAPSLRTQWMSAIRDDERLTKTQQHLALLLATWMDIDGRCFPSLETIARKGHFHKFTVTKTITALIAMGWLVKLSGGGRGKSSHYQALVNGAPASTLSRMNGAPGDLNGAPGSTDRQAQNGAPGSIRSIEVSKEESRPAASLPADAGSPPQEPNPGRSEEEGQVHPSEPTTQPQALDEIARFEAERKERMRQIAAGEGEPWAWAGATFTASDENEGE
jgi:hypothetical protein